MSGIYVGHSSRYEANFYRATLCVSVVFAVTRCLSVRLSVMFVHSIQMAKDIVRLLCRPGSSIILFFDPAPVPNSKGTPSAGTQNKGEGGEKILRFRLKSPYISETVPLLMTLSDL